MTSLICDDNTMIMMGTNIFEIFKVHPVTSPIHDNDIMAIIAIIMIPIIIFKLSNPRYFAVTSPIHDNDDTGNNDNNNNIIKYH